MNNAEAQAALWRLSLVRENLRSLEIMVEQTLQHVTEVERSLLTDAVTETNDAGIQVSAMTSYTPVPS